MSVVAEGCRGRAKLISSGPRHNPSSPIPRDHTRPCLAPPLPLTTVINAETADVKLGDIPDWNGFPPSSSTRKTSIPSPAYNPPRTQWMSNAKVLHPHQPSSCHGPYQSCPLNVPSRTKRTLFIPNSSYTFDLPSNIPSTFRTCSLLRLSPLRLRTRSTQYSRKVSTALQY